MWQDKVLYWAWRGPIPDDGIPPPPTEKRIDYAQITYAGGIQMSLAVTVFDDGNTRDVNRDELDWHRHHGAVILMPPGPIKAS